MSSGGDESSGVCFIRSNDTHTRHKVRVALHTVHLCKNLFFTAEEIKQERLTDVGNVFLLFILFTIPIQKFEVGFFYLAMLYTNKETIQLH